MKKLSALVMIIVMLSGCNSENAGDVTPEPSPEATPMVTEPATPEPADLPTPTSMEHDYEISLPFGKVSLLKGDEYYFITREEDVEGYVVNIYQYSKATDKIKLFKATDCWVYEMFFDVNDHFYISTANTLYRCDEDNDISVISNFRYIVYISAEHIYYLDKNQSLNSFYIEDDTISEIAHLGEHYLSYYPNLKMQNYSPFQHMGLNVVDVRDGNIHKRKSGYLSPDQKYMIYDEMVDERHVFEVLSLENVETTEHVIDGFADGNIEEIQIYNNHLYIITIELDGCSMFRLMAKFILLIK